MWRNLQVPLEGIQAQSEALGNALPVLRVAVRSGDTPSRERAAMVRKPPDILITTPESLHLMLTSRARGIFRGISHVIVDEIHAVCPNKRGVFLALLLERLEAINPGSSCGSVSRPRSGPWTRSRGTWAGSLAPGNTAAGQAPEFRPVTIVDAGLAARPRSEGDLAARRRGGRSTAGSIWPEIEDRLLSLVKEHRSTIIFANNRRTVEKLTSRLNALAGPPGDDETDGDAGVRRTREPEENGMVTVGRPFRPHHGSISLEERRATEEALKQGELTAVVATASLELGIDMGAVDLVCQVESPGSVAAGFSEWAARARGAAA